MICFFLQIIWIMESRTRQLTENKIRTVHETIKLSVRWITHRVMNSHREQKYSYTYFKLGHSREVRGQLYVPVALIPGNQPWY